MSTVQSNDKAKSGKRPLDVQKYPLWKHVEVIRDSEDGGGNRLWSCNYCSHQNRGSYSRVKAHLLGIRNHGIVKCPNVTTEIQKQLTLEVETAALKEVKRAEEIQRKSDYITLPSSSDLVQPKRRRGNLSSIEKSFNLFQRDEIDKDIARMFYSAALPFNFARNPYWRSVCYKLSTYDVAGYCPPTYNRLRTTLLAQENTHIDKLLQPVKDVWVKRGVSICSDGWSDGSNKPIVNIMAASGTTAAVFVNAVDASGIKKDASYIAEIFIDAIKDVGFQNIVQIVTDNGSNFKAAGGLIELEYPSIFWTPCVVHCVNLAFKSICEPSEKSNHFENCKWITKLCGEMNEIQKFVSGHDMVKSLFSRFSKYQLLRVAETRFASHFVVAERLVLVKPA